MCGIIAITGENTKRIQDPVVRQSLDSLSKRGPDEQAFVRINYTVLGQTRLSIVDLSTGNQPMRDNTHPYTIVFNGEIYDYKDLRKDLETKGHRFSTKSDTETILKAYIEYGKECVKYLDGMFAFVIWDEKNNELFFARDRFGKKPLYYTFDNGNLYLASEIKAIFALGIKGIVDPGAIDNYLTLMYVPPWKSIYKNINVVSPAHCGTYKDGQIQINRYWQLEYKPINTTREEAKKEIKKLFDSAVRKRMIADVEIGSLLSGGLDSTIVTAYAQKYSTHPIKTFSVGYEGYINELPYAEQASKKIGTDHYTLQAKSDLTHELEKVIAYMDEPHADSSNFPQHLVSELAGSKVKVALSGDGADELFLGYGWYWKYWNTTKLVRLKNILFSNQFKEHIKNISIFREKERKGIWKNPNMINKDILGSEVEKTSLKGIEKINLFDLTTYLPGQLLSKVDRTSMMHSLEIRCPFLDNKLVEYVYNLPGSFKTDKRNGKIILKEIISEIMPKEFVYRRKQGFGAPVKTWLKTEAMKEIVYKNLNGKAMVFNFLKEEEIEKLLSEFYVKNNDTVYYKIWSLLCLELWFRSHKKYHG